MWASGGLQEAYREFRADLRLIGRIEKSAKAVENLNNIGGTF